MHHIHYMVHVPTYHHDLAVHWFETHGDYYKDDSSLSYVTKVAPSSYCRVIPSDKNIVFIQINDVRENSLTSMSSNKVGSSINETKDPIEFYVRVLLKRNENEKCKKSGKILWYHPYASSKDMYARYIITSEPQIHIWIYKLKIHNTKILDGWLHSHRLRYGGSFLLRGYNNAKKLFYNISDTFENLYNGFVKKNNSFICYDPNPKSSVVKIDNNYYDRRGDFKCKNELITSDYYTFVAFSPKRGNISVFKQHNFILMHTEGHDDYLEIYPTWVENIKNNVVRASFNIM